MKTDRLQDALGMIRDDYVLDAHSERRTDKKIWRRWGTLAACLCLAAVCAIGVPKLLNHQIPALQPNDTPIVEPSADPVTPGTDPAAPQSHGDWPVVYNQVDTMPDGSHYVSLASRPLTDAECAAMIPESLTSWLKLEIAHACFGGYGLDEPGGYIYPEDARLDCVELHLVETSTGHTVRIGMWPAGQTSLFSWAAQFDPEGTQATNFGSDDETRFLTLFQCGDAVWTYFTAGGVSYYVGADAAFRDGVGDNFYSLVLALLRDSDTPDLSILVPNP